jgi:hypothetical protein
MTRRKGEITRAEFQRNWARRLALPPEIVRASTIRPLIMLNVSGTVVSDLDPPICDFFQRAKTMGWH